MVAIDLRCLAVMRLMGATLDNTTPDASYCERVPALAKSAWLHLSRGKVCPNNRDRYARWVATLEDGLRLRLVLLSTRHLSAGPARETSDI